MWYTLHGGEPFNSKGSFCSSQRHHPFRNMDDLFTSLDVHFSCRSSVMSTIVRSFARLGNHIRASLTTSSLQMIRTSTKNILSLSKLSYLIDFVDLQYPRKKHVGHRSIRSSWLEQVKAIYPITLRAFVLASPKHTGSRETESSSWRFRRSTRLPWP